MGLLLALGPLWPPPRAPARPTPRGRGPRPAAERSDRGEEGRRPASRPPGASPLPARSGWRSATAARDLAGVLLIAFGVLGALGIYGGLAGPAGNGIDTATGAVIGLVRWFVPPALVVAGLLLLRNAPEEDAPGSDDPLLGVRLALAAALLTIAVTGLLHLGRGEPPWGSPAADFVAAGGVLGAAVARPWPPPSTPRGPSWRS